MKNLALIISVVLMYQAPLNLFAVSISGYQEEAQKTFMNEAAKPGLFKKAVQTARLLAYLEFMPSESFAGFHACLSKEKTWAYLSAKHRERLLNSCRATGRAVSSATPVSGKSISGGIRPAAEKKQEQSFYQVHREIDQLRSLIDSLAKDVRVNQDRLLDSLNALEQQVVNVSVPPVVEQSPPSDENY